MKHLRISELNEVQAKQFNFDELGVSEYKKDFAFLVFDEDELIAKYILMNNNDHESYEGISKYLELNSDETGYLYWIETRKRNALTKQGEIPLPRRRQVVDVSPLFLFYLHFLQNLFTNISTNDIIICVAT